MARGLRGRNASYYETPSEFSRGNEEGLSNEEFSLDSSVVEEATLKAL